MTEPSSAIAMLLTRLGRLIVVGGDDEELAGIVRKIITADTGTDATAAAYLGMAVAQMWSERGLEPSLSAADRALTAAGPAFPELQIAAHCLLADLMRRKADIYSAQKWIREARTLADTHNASIGLISLVEGRIQLTLGKALVAFEMFRISASHLDQIANANLRAFALCHQVFALIYRNFATAARVWREIEEIAVTNSLHPAILQAAELLGHMLNHTPDDDSAGCAMRDAIRLHYLLRI